MGFAFDLGQTLAGTAGFAALVSYVMCGVIARKSPALGGGTRVLSWVGLCIPCIAWLSLYQEHSAVQAFARLQPGAEAEKVRRSFNAWLVAYVVFMVVASVLAKSHAAVPGR